MFFRKKKLPTHSCNKSPAYDGYRFYNPIRKKTFQWKNAYFLLFLKKTENWPRWIPSTQQELSPRKKEHVALTFINHSSFLARYRDMNVLFDPIFSHRMGPYCFGIKRRRVPGVDLHSLGRVDLILISHNHYDHLDLPCLRELCRKFQPKILVPMGDKSWLEKKGLKNIEEMGWWEKKQITEKVMIHFLPAQHSSGRTLFDQDKSLWGSFLVEHPDLHLYHAGDTGYSAHLEAIGKKFSIDVALLPIGASKPSWLLRAVHMDSFDAIQAHIELGAKRSYAMHFDTFPLGHLEYGEAEKELEELLHMASDRSSFSVPKAGTTYHIEEKHICQ